jgi:hypothetical protein
MNKYKPEPKEEVITPDTVTCRRCVKKYKKWKNPYCRFCWDKFYRYSYIPDQQELLEFTNRKA